MAGILKVDQYQDFNGNNIMTSDGAGNLTLNNAALKMTPNFFVYRNSGGDQSITANTVTKVQFDDEFYDSDNVYDNSTNYRFTVPSGQSGKYFIYSALRVDGTSMNNGQIRIYKNGTGVTKDQNILGSGNYSSFSLKTYAALDLSVGDYVEIYVYVQSGSSITVDAKLDPMTVSYFGGYKLIGA